MTPEPPEVMAAEMSSAASASPSARMMEACFSYSERSTMYLARSASW